MNLIDKIQDKYKGASLEGLFKITESGVRSNLKIFTALSRYCKIVNEDPFIYLQFFNEFDNEMKNIAYSLITYREAIDLQKYERTFKDYLKWPVKCLYQYITDNDIQLIEAETHIKIKDFEITHPMLIVQYGGKPHYLAIGNRSCLYCDCLEDIFCYFYMKTTKYPQLGFLYVSPPNVFNDRDHLAIKIFNEFDIKKYEIIMRKKLEAVLEIYCLDNFNEESILRETVKEDAT